MKKKNKGLFIIAIFLSTVAQGQITKGNWLVGGNLNFSSANGESISSTGTQKSTYSNISISPNIGYFIIEKFAAGLKTNFTNAKSKDGDMIRDGITVGSGGHSNTTWFDFGPFTRYYFLPSDNQVNLFSEANFMYGTANSHPGKGSRYSYSFYAGSAVYFNSSVALEFTIGYNSSKSTLYGLNSRNDDYTNKNNAIQIGIGFQIHLEKE